MTISLPHDPSRVTMAGDWHGSSAWAEHAVYHAKLTGSSVILHLGDFGYWTEGPLADNYIEVVDAALKETGLTLFWIDGNHECHPRLRELPIDSDTGLRPITERIAHLPRGFRWSWAGVTWLALGGAYSIDQFMRKEGVSWWPEEIISEDDVSRAVSGGPADVIIAHDAPDRIIIPGINNSSSSWPLDAIARSQRNQEAVGRVVDGTGATRLFHGHMHVKYQTVRISESGHVTEVTGLDCDGTSMGRNLLSFSPVDMAQPLDYS